VYRIGYHCTAGRVHTAGRAMITNTIHTACRVYSIYAKR